jgi:hypothetical protein
MKEKTIRILKRHILAEEDEVEKGAYSWTLVSVLGEALLMAEELFGKRDKTYTILGIDYAEEAQVCCPPPRRAKHLIVQISKECLLDREDAYFQLSHEVVHLISPTGKRDANNLEEGLAVYFSIYYMNYVFENYDGFWTQEVPYEDYRKAYEATKKLLELYKDAIKKLRKTQKVISKISKEQIMSLYPDFTEPDAEFLAQNFYPNISN